MSRYINDKGQAAPTYLTDEQGRRVYHPTEAMLEAAGYRKAEPHRPTEAEVAEMERVAEIERLKEQLAATDYKAIKHAEGWLTTEEYAPTKAQRQQWRERINELEGGGDR